MMDDHITPITLIHSAGILLHLLQEMKETDFTVLQSSAHIDDLNFYMAIGYLVRDSQVIFFDGTNGLRIRLVEQTN